MLMERTLHRACENCHAPGHYTCNPLIRDGYNEEQILQLQEAHPEITDVYWFRRGWKEVYDPSRDGQPVGLECPVCGSPRRGARKLKTLKVEGRLF